MTAQLQKKFNSQKKIESIPERNMLTKGLVLRRWLVKLMDQISTALSGQREESLFLSAGRLPRFAEKFLY